MSGGFQNMEEKMKDAPLEAVEGAWSHDTSSLHNGEMVHIWFLRQLGCGNSLQQP
jgi:hypothetical protein